MRQEPIPSNLADDPLEKAADLFQDVQLAAQEYEQHQGHSTDLLHRALARLYDFGERLRIQMTGSRGSVMEEFVRSKGRPWNKATRKNPYNALTQIVFSEASASSRSQYATVLAYASDTREEPDCFKDWLGSGKGIKGRHTEALEHFGSPRRQRNALDRAGRLEAAKAKLIEREHSSAVALPSGVMARPGFALLLASIDEAGQARIIDVAETRDAAIENVLLRYERGSATGNALLAAEPLGRLHRAIDLVLGSTADKSSGHARHVLILNTLERGNPVCHVWAISEAYNYAWSGVTLAGHAEGLPVSMPLTIAPNDAAYFRAEFPNSGEWTVSTQPTIRIHNGSESSSITLEPLKTGCSYRVGRVPARREKPVSATYQDKQAVLRFLAERRAEHERRNARAKQKQPFSRTVTIQSISAKLQIGLPKMLAVSACLGTSSPNRDLSERAFDTEELTRVLGAFASYGAGSEGTFIDTDGVVDAGLCLQSWFGEDIFSVVVPTRSGTAINPTCLDLDLLVGA